MHESGLANAVAATLRGQSLEGVRVRLHVQGGHSGPDDFDDAFRFHLLAAAPDLADVPIQILHVPIERLCVTCGGRFAAIASDVPCPECGGAALPTDACEHLEIELVGLDDDVH